MPEKKNRKIERQRKRGGNVRSRKGREVKKQKEAGKAK